MRRAFLALSFALLAANAYAAKPRPPSSFCVDEKCAPDPVQTRIMKWHPGHYMWLDRNNTSVEIRAEHMRQIDLIANEPSVRGVKLALYWSALEKTPGDYSAGFAVVDQYLAKLKGTNKYLILSVQDRQFGGYEPSVSGLSYFFPTYIVTGTQYGLTKMSNGITARIWQQATMDRLIALTRALAARYDGHPNFEMYQVEETSIAVTRGLDGYSIEALGAQFKRLLSASRGSWKQTTVRLPTNYFGSDAQMSDLFAFCKTNNLAVGGPDVIPNQSIQADRLFMGGAGVDMRGVIPWVSEVQSPSLGGHKGTFTPKQIYDNGMLRSPSHFLWYRNTWSGGVEQKWDTGILPFIRSIKGVTKSTCPVTYAGACSG